MDRQQAIDLAIRHAKANPESYYVEPFIPHWVINAVMAAANSVECITCNGLGHCDDSECGDIFYNTWACKSCNGTGLSNEAYDPKEEQL